MNRPGFISVFALLILSLVFINVSYLLYIGSLQLALSNYSVMSTKANYIFEDRLNRVIYNEEKIDEYFRGTVLNESRRRTIKEDRIWKLSCKDDDFKSGKFKIINGEKKTVISELQSDYKDINFIFKVEDEIINNLFEMKLPIIDKNTLDDEEEFINYLDLLKEEAEDYDFKSNKRLEPKAYKYNMYNFGEIKLENNRKILYDREENFPKDIFRFTNEILILNILPKEEFASDVKLLIGEKDNLDNINLKGVLYVQGDLILNQNLDLEGIIIVDEGSIIFSEGVNLNIKGMMFYNGEENLNLENIEVEYDQKEVYVYGSYLPGYIESKIINIKKD